MTNRVIGKNGFIDTVTRPGNIRDGGRWSWKDTGSAGLAYAEGSRAVSVPLEDNPWRRNVEYPGDNI